MSIRTVRLSAQALLAAAVLALTSAPSLAGGDWNDSAVAWKPYEQGLAEAKEANKPICLVFYTDWCPHCTNYSKVFHDPAVVEASAKLVMIRINKDQDKPASARYAPDGEYIPRTYFLEPDGTLLDQVTENRPNYRYFYDEHDPKSVLRSMNTVVAMTFDAVPAAADASKPAANP